MFTHIESHFAPIENDMAVYISDMSGTTKTTRLYGITHYCSIVLRQRAITVPVLKHYGATHIFFEADNIWAMFPDPENAVTAALEVMAKIKTLNETLEEKWKMNISGVGLAYGGGIVIDEEDGKFYGATVDRSFLLGEDLSHDFGVFVSEELFEKIESEDLKELFSSNEHEEAGVFFTDNGSYAAQTTLEDEANEHYKPLLERIGKSETELEEIDASLQQYLQKDLICVMWGANWDDITESFDVNTMFSLYSDASDVIRDIFVSHNGIYYERSLYVFQDANDALNASLAARDVLSTKTYEELNGVVIPLKGFGMHTGDLFVLPNTDVHWGDLVNTASKLGEDIATGGVVNVSEKTAALLETSLTTIKTVDISGVALTYYEL